MQAICKGVGKKLGAMSSPPEFVTDVTYFEVVEAGGCETVGSIHHEITQALNDLDSWNISTDQDIKVGY